MDAVPEASGSGPVRRTVPAGSRRVRGTVTPAHAVGRRPPPICEHDPMPEGADQRGTWVIDLDGVIWLAEDPIPGSAEAVALLRGAGFGVVFATNNASPTIAELGERLADAGIEADPGDLVTSAAAA